MAAASPILPCGFISPETWVKRQLSALPPPPPLPQEQMSQATQQLRKNCFGTEGSLPMEIPGLQALAYAATCAETRAQRPPTGALLWPLWRKSSKVMKQNPVWWPCWHTLKEVSGQRMT